MKPYKILCYQQSGTINTKMGIFQIKIHQIILTANKFLKICEIQNDDRRRFCCTECETSEQARPEQRSKCKVHYFWSVRNEKRKKNLINNMFLYS